MATATLAPVGMIGGWTLTQALEPWFDPLRGTISALAIGPVQHSWVMTAGLALTGLGHLGTAVGLRSAAPAGRVLLALGGIGALAVAAFPTDVAPTQHALAAAIAFGALSLWPAGAWRRRWAGRPWVLAPGTSFAVTGVLLALLGWFAFGVPQIGGETLTGLAERVLAGAQVLWPLAVVLVIVRGGRNRARHAG